MTRILSLAAFALVCPLLISAAPADLTAGKIIFKNPGPYAQKDLEAASDMHPGAKVANATLQAAAQKLMDTGLFDDVGVQVEGPAASLNVTYILKPADVSKFIAVGFENFVWLTPEELTKTVHASAPLFQGKLPEAGNQLDAITAGLQAALTAKGVTYPVAHETLQPSADQPILAIEFSVQKAAVRIHSVSLQGVAPDIAPAENKVTEKLRGTRYNEGLLDISTADLLLQPYFQQGYAAAHLTNVQRTVVSSTPAEVGVDITASVNAGEPYRLSAMTFSGNTLISSEEIMKTATIHAGDIASTDKISLVMETIRHTYAHQGYMDAVVVPVLKLDTAAHTVSYDLQVQPGEQYRLRTVTPVNLSGDALRDFDTGWRMKPGDLYDADYVATFLKNNTALRSLSAYTAAFQASADPQTHQVDLTIKFVRMGAH